MRVKVGVIGERHNRLSYWMLQKSFACRDVEVVWFADSTLSAAAMKKFVGDDFDEGPLVAALARLRGMFRRATPASDADCRQFCADHGIPYHLPGGHSLNTGLPPRMYEQPEVDYVMIGGCDQLMDANGLRLGRKAVVNYHYSPLPAYRGKFAAFWQWYNREPFIAYTYHFVDLGIDTGRIVYQGKVSYSPDEPFGKVASRVTAESTDVVCEVYANLEAGTTTALEGPITSSFYPSKRRLELLTAGPHRTVREMEEVFRRVGHLRLANGLVISRVLETSPEQISAVALDRDGIRIPLRDGHLRGRVACTLPYPLFRICFARRIARELK